MTDVVNYDLAEYELSYAGLNSRRDLGFIVGRVSKPLAPSMSEVTQSVPGKYGNIYTGTNYGSMTFNIPITILADSAEEYNRKIENIRNAFIDSYHARNLEYPLIFGDRPEITYYGHWTALPDPTFLTETDWDVQTTLQFTCSEPYGYGEQEIVKLNHANQVFTPKGNTFTYPVYVMDLKTDVINLGYVDHTTHAYVATGYTVDIDNTDELGNKISNKEPLSVNEPDSDLSQWTTDSNSTHTVDIDDGEVDGEMDFYAGWGLAPAKHEVTDLNNNTTQNRLNFGDGTKHKNWYGPLAVHRNFPNPTNNWQLSVTLRHAVQYKPSMGKIEVYLLDEGGNRCGKIWIRDQAHGSIPHMGVQLGSKAHNVEILKKDPADQSDDSSNDYVGPTTIPGTDKNFINVSDDKDIVTLTTVLHQKRYVQDPPDTSSSSDDSDSSDSDSDSSSSSNYGQGTPENPYTPVTPIIPIPQLNYDNIPVVYPTTQTTTKKTSTKKGTSQKASKSKTYVVNTANLKTKKGKTVATNVKIQKKKKTKTATATKYDKNGVPIFEYKGLKPSLVARIVRKGLNPDNLELRAKSKKVYITVNGVKRHVNWNNSKDVKEYNRERRLKTNPSSGTRQHPHRSSSASNANKKNAVAYDSQGHKYILNPVTSKRTYVKKGGSKVNSRVQIVKPTKTKTYKPKVVKVKTVKAPKTTTTKEKTGVSSGSGGSNNSSNTTFQYIPSGDWVDANADVQNPDGTHWENRDYTQNQITEQLGLDAGDDWYYTKRFSPLSNFCGTLYIRKVDSHFSVWLQMRENGLEGMPIGTTIAQRDFEDTDGEFQFDLASVAVWTAKHNIDDDIVNPPHPYDDTKTGLQGIQYWSIYGAGNVNQSTPSVIAQTGERIYIDTSQMKVYKEDGTDLTKYTSFASSFPPLRGGVQNQLSFDPQPGDDSDIYVEYRPRIK